jgi:hypothetical protein
MAKLIREDGKCFLEGVEGKVEIAADLLNDPEVFQLISNSVDGIRKPIDLSAINKDHPQNFEELLLRVKDNEHERAIFAVRMRHLRNFMRNSEGTPDLIVNLENFQRKISQVQELTKHFSMKEWPDLYVLQSELSALMARLRVSTLLSTEN